MKFIQEMILNFLENETSKEEFSINFIKYLDQENIRKNRHDLRLVLHIISQISLAHFRTQGFLGKINHILILLKDEITNFFTNFEIYDLFSNNLPVLAFLFENKILFADEDLFEMQFTYNDPSRQYLIPEFKVFYEKIPDKKIKQYYEKFMKIENYSEKRKIAENDSYICQLIRDDSVEEFIAFVNRTNISISKTFIETSFFETNYNLIGDDKVTFIEYAAFFGSIKIFRYLQLNNVELESSLWSYAIHSNMPEMIHLLEELHVEPDDKTYNKCLFYAIENHHNNVARYIQDNLLNGDLDYQYYEKLKFYNFSMLADIIDRDIENIVNDKKKLNSLFFDFCRNDCYTLVEFLLNNAEIDINARIILNQILFFLI